MLQNKLHNTLQKIKNIKGALRKEHRTKYPSFLIREPRYFIDLPSLKDVTKIDIKYPLLEPFTVAHIKWDKKEKTLLYIVEEPKLDPEEARMLKKMETALSELIDVRLSVIKNRFEAMNYLHKKVVRILEDLGMEISYQKYTKIMYYIIRNFIGLNEIESLMHDPYIEDIGVDGIGSPVYVTHRKFGTMASNIVFNDHEYLSNFVIKISERCGRYISYASPLLDGSLPDGSRIQASLAKDVTTKGPTFSIRKFRKNPLSPIDIISLKTASAELVAYLWLLVEHNISVLVCGGVSTGKTTFLNILSMFIPKEDKIISIEDTREINLPHDNWIPSVARTGFGVPEAGGKKYGEISLFDLLRESFRQNPDYVIVGEVRSKEAYVMFQGMASGHPSMGTMHAGSVEDVIKRLETPPIELSPSLVESLDVIIVLTNAKERGESARRIKEIVEIQSVDPETGSAHTIRTFSWMPMEDTFKKNTVQSELLKRLSFQKGMSYESIEKELKDRELFIKWMQKHKISDFDSTCGVINIYKKDKKTAMRWVKNDTSPSKLENKELRKEKLNFVTGLKVIK
jgi:flagellar protein FlaI